MRQLAVTVGACSAVNLGNNDGGTTGTTGTTTSGPSSGGTTSTTSTSSSSSSGSTSGGPLTCSAVGGQCFTFISEGHSCPAGTVSVPVSDCFGVCIRPGAGGNLCLVGTVDYSLRCAQGTFCLGVALSGPVCVAACDATAATNPCPTGRSCVAWSPEQGSAPPGDTFGICI